MVELFHIKAARSELFCSERQRILTMLQNLLPFAKVTEVGSTAIEGVIGKEDLDIFVCVPRSRFVDARKFLDAQFERNKNQFADAEFQGYHVVSPLDACVQLTVTGGQHDHFELFRDRLRADLFLRNAYNDLKRAWDGRPMAQYRRAKSEFIVEVLMQERPDDSDFRRPR